MEPEKSGARRQLRQEGRQGRGGSARSLQRCRAPSHVGPAPTAHTLACGSERAGRHGAMRRGRGKSCAHATGVCVRVCVGNVEARACATLPLTPIAWGRGASSASSAKVEGRARAAARSEQGAQNGLPEVRTSAHTPHEGPPSPAVIGVCSGCTLQAILLLPEGCTEEREEGGRRSGVRRRGGREIREVVGQ